MGGTRNIYDHPFCGNDLAHGKVGEEEVTQVVGSKMHFESVCGLYVVLYGHDTGVVDQDIKVVDASVDCLRCLLNRGVIAKIESYDHNINLGIHF
jgi:hypothetical protein